MYGDSAGGPGICGTSGGTGVGLPGGATLRGAGSCPPIDPLLERFALLLLASEVDQDTFTPGDPWENLGTAGSDLDAVPDGTPLLVNNPTAGFVTADGSSGSFGAASPFYYVPDNTLLDPGTGSFTAFAKTLWTVASPGGNENVQSKITGTVSQPDGRGWTMFDSNFFPGAAIAIQDTAGNFAFAVGPDHLTPGERLLVGRLDRDTDLLTLFIDNVAGTPADASGVGEIVAVHELIFGRGCEQTVRAYGYIPEPLTDDEITADLPAALAT